MQTFDAVQNVLVGLMEQSGTTLQRLKEIQSHVNSLPNIDIPTEDLIRQKQFLEQQIAQKENQRLELQNQSLFAINKTS
jgi:hypothetical protein